MTDHPQTAGPTDNVTKFPSSNERKGDYSDDFPILKGLIKRLEKSSATGTPEVVREESPFSSKEERESGANSLDEHRPIKSRHIAIALAFFISVALPATFTSVYMAFIAADQYHSSASFSVRSIESSQPSDILGMFTQASSGSTASDSYVLLDFIRSDRMVQMVDSQFNLDMTYAPRGWDVFYGIGKNLPIEEKLAYWKRMVNINFDHSSGIINVEVKAFTPADSQKITAFVIAQSEKLINSLSLSARDEVLKVSEREVRVSEERLASARTALRVYRDSSQEANPVEGAKLATQLVAGLEEKLVQLKTELSTALTQMGEDTPRVRVVRSQIGSLEKQIEQERTRFGGGNTGKQSRSAQTNLGDVASRIQQYETLDTDREFAERAYSSALVALEKARIEATAKQRYLAVFIQPTLSEYAQYPTRLFNSFLILIASLLAWAVVVLGYYNIRDRN